jgi:hypothetical protein
METAKDEDEKTQEQTRTGDSKSPRQRSAGPLGNPLFRGLGTFSARFPLLPLLPYYL